VLLLSRWVYPLTQSPNYSKRYLTLQAAEFGRHCVESVLWVETALFECVTRPNRVNQSILKRNPVKCVMESVFIRSCLRSRSIRSRVAIEWIGADWNGLAISISTGFFR